MEGSDAVHSPSNRSARITDGVTEDLESKSTTWEGYMKPHPPGEETFFDAREFPETSSNRPTSEGEDETDTFTSRAPVERGSFTIDLRSSEDRKNVSSSQTQVHVMESGRKPGVVVTSFPSSEIEEKSAHGVVEVQRCVIGVTQVQSFAYAYAGKDDDASSSPHWVSAFPTGTTSGSTKRDFWSKYTAKVNDGRQRSAKFLVIMIQPTEERSQFSYRCRLHVLDESQNLLISSNFSPFWTYTKNRGEPKHLSLDSTAPSAWYPILTSEASPAIHPKIMERSLSTGSGSADRTTPRPRKRSREVEGRANSNVGGLVGWTPLQIASDSGNHNMVEILLENLNSSNIDAATPEGDTALHLSCRKGFSGVVQLLLDGGANAGLRDKDQRSPLHVAAFGGHTDAVKSLLAANVDRYVTDSMGFTPLHWATINNFPAVARLLLNQEKGNDPAEKDMADAALSLASLNTHEEL